MTHTQVVGNNVDNNIVPSTGNPIGASPALRDAMANASYDYDEALMAYEDALASRDGAKRTEAESRLHEATRRLSAAQVALASTNSTSSGPTFDDLLSDSTQQLDPNGVVMASVLAYRTAAPATASASPTWMDFAPHEVRAATYVHERVSASTMVSTAS